MVFGSSWQNLDMQHRDFLVLILAAVVLILIAPPVFSQDEFMDKDMRMGIVEPRGMRGEAAQTSSVKTRKMHKWQDAANIVSLWESEELVMERYNADEQSEQSPPLPPSDVIASDGKLRVVKKQSWHQLGGDVFPVLVSQMGGWQALPGGVLVVLDPKMNKADIDAFFAKLNISKASKMDFTKNAFSIETKPGIVGLELSNKLAKMKAVKLSSPNWWSSAELR